MKILPVIFSMGTDPSFISLPVIFLLVRIIVQLEVTNCDLKFVNWQDALFKITICDPKESCFFLVSSNMKSSRKRAIFLRADCFNSRVSTPYISAKAWSSITRSPRMMIILLTISSTAMMAFVFFGGAAVRPR